MSGTDYLLWCYVEGDNTVIPLTVSSEFRIGQLKKKIKEEKSVLLREVDSSSLTLNKVDVRYGEEIRRKIRTGQYRPTLNDQVLDDEMESISAVWTQPPDRHIHVFAGLPSDSIDRPALRQPRLSGRYSEAPPWLTELCKVGRVAALVLPLYFRPDIGILGLLSYLAILNSISP